MRRSLGQDRPTSRSGCTPSRMAHMHITGAPPHQIIPQECAGGTRPRCRLTPQLVRTSLCMPSRQQVPSLPVTTPASTIGLVGYTSCRSDDQTCRLHPVMSRSDVNCHGYNLHRRNARFIRSRARSREHAHRVEHTAAKVPRSCVRAKCLQPCRRSCTVHESRRAVRASCANYHDNRILL